ncbi:GMC family oxidoreductase [Aspergillus undulatus]|uniref:GMC family oxidoreductase n=1 Tax=Aspergillus undulatus TaxID=1810928 RepID=UPI003CCE280B
MRLHYLLLGLGQASGCRLPAEKPSDNSQSDYVILGAGPAGYVLATRLSEDPTVTVILLEAGPDGSGDRNMYTPGFAGRLQNSPYVWNYTSQPDPRRGGIAPRFPQGHALGGGTSVNFMSYSRGAASVYDQWASDSGNERLAFHHLFEQFERSTNLTVPSPTDYKHAAAPGAYGDGPVQVSYEWVATDTEPYFGDAMAASMSQPVHLLDPATGHHIGRVNGGPHTIDLQTGRRSSAQVAYGMILSLRQNVNIITRAEATKIDIQNRQAVSVQYVAHDDQTNHTISARREIIVSAGAIGSPKLLMLSGLGPRDHLQELGIPVVKEIPEMGNNLHNHHNAITMSQISEDIITAFKLRINASLLAEAEAEYEATGRGPLSEILTSSYVTERPSDEFLDSINATFHKALPIDRPLLFYGYTTSPLLPNPGNVNVMSAFVCLLQPEAPGYVRLASADYRDAPLIFSNYWGSDADFALVLYGYKKLRGVMASDILAPIVLQELYPGPDAQTDEEVTQAMLDSAWSFNHPTGTCSLGRVLDPRFRISGIGGLRVVDTSVFPYQPTSHTSGPTYAVAELAAKIIKEEWY